MAKDLNLLSNMNRIEAPFVKVTIGDYTFGVYSRSDATKQLSSGFYTAAHIQYPNYITSLNVQKINGKINKYTLVIFYAIRPGDDPNFFEKVFSSVSSNRTIIFSYGDMNLPTFAYRDEEALITNVDPQIDVRSSVITYTVSATSKSLLGNSGSITVGSQSPIKPSDEIKRLLQDKTTGLADVFYGMTDIQSTKISSLIASDDKYVNVPIKTNMSPLDALEYLVSCMEPLGSTGNSLTSDVYIMTIHDDTTGNYPGPYFKVTRVSSKVEHSDAYVIDIGYPTRDIVTNLTFNSNTSYALLYEWQGKLTPSSYVSRIDNKGNIVQEYAPAVSSKNNQRLTTQDEKTWWTKLTQFPISATIQIKGLLRPAILMTHVRLNIWFYGVKHVTSGLYIITSQQDSISSQGYRTTLTLTRISGDEA